MSQPINQAQIPSEEKKNDQTVIIMDLHENVTEEMLWKHMQTFGKINKIKFPRKQKQKALRSRGFAIVSFSELSGYREALERADQTPLIGKPIRVLPFYEKNKLNEFKKFNLFIKGFGPKSNPQKLKEAIIKELGSPIFSFKLAFDDKKSELRGYGYCSFFKEDDKKKLVDLKSIKIDDQEVHFFEFKKPEPLRNNIYLKNFFQGEISDQLLNDAQQREQFEQLQKKSIEKLVYSTLNEQVVINSIFVKIDPQNKKPFAFICFKDEADAIKFNEILNQKKTIYSNIQEPQHKASSSSSNVLLLKNIRPDADWNKLKEIIERKYGQITQITQFKEPKKREQQPNNNNNQKKDFKDARQSTVFFKKEEDSNKLLRDYTEDKELLDLFVDNVAYVNISLKSEEREKYMITIQNRNVSLTNQQVASAQADEQQQRFQAMPPMFPFNIMGMRPQMPYQMPFNPMMRQPNMQGPRQQNRYNNRQFQGPRNQFHSNNRQYPNPNYINNQNRPLNSVQQQAQIPQNNMIGVPQQPPNQPDQQQKNTWEYIKNNLDEFLKRPQQEKRNILGQLIYPKVVEVCNNKTNAPKITGMLIDFTVFEEQDVIEFLENPAELKERVTEAEQLIDQSSTATVASQNK